MKILVTGGGGFIGKALVKRLLDEGHLVSSLSRGDYPDLEEIGVKVFRADLQDIESVNKAVAGKEIVFHVGARAGFWGSYKEYYNVNVSGSNNVIRACQQNGVGSLIYTSSASVVFDGNDIEGLNEDLPYPTRPLSHYTGTKALAEQAVIQANSLGLKTLSLRPHLVWGPGDRHILPKIIKQARAGKLRIIGDGKNLIDSTYIDNAVTAHICAAKALADNPNVGGKCYFISNGEPVSLWELLNDLLKVSGIEAVNTRIPTNSAITIAGFLELIYKTLPISSSPRLTRFLVHELSASHWFDISAAKTELGYEPMVSIKEGLQFFAEYNSQVIQ